MGHAKYIWIAHGNGNNVNDSLRRPVMALGIELNSSRISRRENRGCEVCRGRLLPWSVSCDNIRAHLQLQSGSLARYRLRDTLLSILAVWVRSPGPASVNCSPPTDEGLGQTTRIRL